MQSKAKQKRTDLTNEINTDALVFNLLHAFSEIHHHFTLHRLIVHIHIKVLRFLFASNLNSTPSLAHIEDDGRFCGAAEQPGLKNHTKHQDFITRC